MSAMLTPSALSAGLTVRRVGRCIVCLDGTGSTNDDAFALAASAGMTADGTVIFAERQAAGRGRLGHTWISPRGASIQCSTVLCGDSPDCIAHVSLAAGIAACRAIAGTTDLTPSVRWPNDVFIKGRKVGGVLVERRDASRSAPAVIVIGIGINCLQQRGHLAPALGERATSLEIESRAPVDRTAVARALLVALDGWFGNRHAIDPQAVVDGWRDLSDDLGTRVTVDASSRRLTGRILDIAPDAALLLQTDDGARVALDAALTSVIERHS